jgi:small subunit ribosomal protein S2
LLCRVIAEAVNEGRFIYTKKHGAAPVSVAPVAPAPLTAEQKAAKAAAQADARNQAAAAQAEREARLAAAKSETASTTSEA